jgi:hypothetical protein
MAEEAAGADAPTAMETEGAEGMATDSVEAGEVEVVGEVPGADTGSAAGDGEGGATDGISADGAGEETMAGGAGDETMAGSDLEGAEQEAAAVPEDAVFAQRDRLESLLAAEEPDIEAVCGILDALMGKWNDIQVKQVVLGPPFTEGDVERMFIKTIPERSLGMIVRRLRKHEDEKLANLASRLFDMYQSECVPPVSRTPLASCCACCVARAALRTHKRCPTERLLELHPAEASRVVGALAREIGGR